MNEHREKYKELMLEAARIAVRGGAMSIAFEDFLIDYIDEIVDSLNDGEFISLVQNGKQKIKRIVNDKEYVRYSDWITIAKETLNKDVNIMERRWLERYISALLENTTKYERVHDLSIRGQYIPS